MHYREANSKLPGHPELGLTPGVKFSSGRLGHMWYVLPISALTYHPDVNHSFRPLPRPMVNGVAMAHPDQIVFCLGSDGSQQEGNDAEAARIAVANNLNVKLLIDDNDVTIAGHPSEYLKGFDVAATLAAHGLKVITVQGEDIDALWGALCEIVKYKGPAAGLFHACLILRVSKYSSFELVVAKRKMAVGVPDIEGSTHGHDVIPVKSALRYFEKRGYPDWSGLYTSMKAAGHPYLYLGSTKELGANRVVFGEAVNLVLDTLSKEEAKAKVMVIDSSFPPFVRCVFLVTELSFSIGDLEGSTGLKVIHQKHPEVFYPSGIMERANFSAAAGFGFDADKFGVFSTFSAFLEMVVSEVTMARLNNCNVLSHFSHSGGMCCASSVLF
jgi:hypothetical protein